MKIRRETSKERSLTSLLPVYYFEVEVKRKVLTEWFLHYAFLLHSNM